MARYELILKQDEAIWLRITSGPLLTPQKPCFRGAPAMEEAMLQMCAWDVTIDHSNSSLRLAIDL